MRFASLQEGKILKRYKRFFADIELPDGRLVVAHVPNTGSMATCWEPGWTVWLSPASNPTRKLQWTLEIVQSENGFILVNTALANKLAREALESQRLAPFHGYRQVQAEQSILESRFDFHLTEKGQTDIWIEVKNVTLKLKADWAAFPDAVSSRGLKHLEDLITLKEMGHRAAMLYVISRSDVANFTPATHIDPKYALKLREAYDLGVEVYCYRVERESENYFLQTPVSLEFL